MSEVKTRPWTQKEIKLLVDQVPPPITPERYPPNPKTEADRALIRVAKEDGRFLDLNEAQRRIIDGRFPVEDALPTSFYSLGQELGMSSSSVRKSYERIIKGLKAKK
ncbi:MAG TPA: hypothetical protein VFA93_01235 [Patescibacteria group bacterium]|nr:hypothetical protein [Patescibacteria group bacterium]